ncbi:MAG: carboxypeptidase-like regulatory domain-containing protein, partial [Bryobacteraceae bacterium]
MLKRFVAGLWVAAQLVGQTGSGNITGVVRDASQSPVPQSAIKVVNSESGVVTNVVTNETGAYRVNSILPGTYRVEASAAGFDTAVRKDIVLSTGQTLAVDLTLQIGQQSQTVTVESAGDLTETQTSSLAQVVGHKYIDNLPLPNRSANSLVSLSPGVVMLDPGQGAENYPVFSVAGGRVRNQMFTLDGGAIGNAVGLTRALQVASLPLDALEEFRIITNSYAAEYGHSTGGIVSLSTRSGTNEYHGSLFEYLRNDALDARNYFAKTKPPLRLNQFGGAFGGPIRKDKTHFFASWEQTRQASSDAIVSTVPTLAQRGGDFSALSSRIYDPFTLVNAVKQPFPDNRIPASRIDPVAKAASAYWPLPNRNGGANGANNFLANSGNILNRNIVVGKLDHSISEKDRVSARYYINDSYTDNSGSYGIADSDPLAVNSDVRIQSVLGTYIHTFNPTLLNSFQVSYMQRKYLQTRAGKEENLAGKIGLTGVSAAAFPTFNVAGYALLRSQGIANSSIARLQTPIRDTQFQDSISKFAGKHAFKAGVEYRFGYNNESNDLSSSGNLVFNRLITGLPGTSTSGEAYASFLVGAANSASLNKSDVITSRAAYWAAYVQDDYRVTDRLTLNIGLRWEVETPRRVDNNKLNAFDRTGINPVSGTPGVVTFAGQNGIPNTSFAANYKNFGPRVGFAYKAPFARDLVIRGGGGLFYGPNLSNSVTTGASLGFADNASFVSSQQDTTYALLLANGFPAYVRPSIDTPGFGAVKVGQKPTTAVTFFDRNRQSPVSYQFNFDLQKEF